MAVIFISPKKRQKAFFVVITAVFLVFLSTVSLLVILSQPPESSPSYNLVFNKPKVDINMKFLDFQQFKDLEPFPKMSSEFSYKAVTNKGKTEQGTILALSIDEAKKKLESSGLIVVDIAETGLGRENPFMPY